MDFKVLIPIIIIQVILVLIAGFDLVKRNKSNIKGDNKVIWLIVIVLISIIGPISYLTLGKKD